MGQAGGGWSRCGAVSGGRYGAGNGRVWGHEWEKATRGGRGAAGGCRRGAAAARGCRGGRGRVPARCRCRCRCRSRRRPPLPAHPPPARLLPLPGARRFPPERGSRGSRPGRARRRRHGVRGPAARPGPAAPRQRRLPPGNGAAGGAGARGRGGSRRGGPSAARRLPGLGVGPAAWEEPGPGRRSGRRRGGVRGVPAAAVPGERSHG